MKIPFHIVRMTILASFAAGCVSVNSTKPDDRLAAVAAMTDENELFSAVGETRFSDARNAAASRISREDLSIRLLQRHDLYDSTRLRLVGNVINQSELKRLVLEQSNPTWLKSAARAKINDETVLVECAGQSTDQEVSSSAAVRIVGEENCKELFYRKGLDKSVKMILLDKINDDSFLRAVVENVENDYSIRKSALSRIKSETNFRKLFTAEPHMEVWVRETAIRQISDQSVIIAALCDKESNLSIRKLALERIEDETVLIPVITDMDDDPSIRQMALEAVKTETTAKQILETKPILESWICSRAVELLSDQKKLSEVMLDSKFDDEVRLKAGNKISDPSMILDVLLSSDDDLAAGFALDRLGDNPLNSEEAQRRLLKLFRSTANTGLMEKAWKRLGPGVNFYRKGDQTKIVSMLNNSDDKEAKERMLENVFDPECLFDLGSGQDERLAKSVIRLRPDPETTLRIIGKTPFTSIQCAALSILEEERDIARIAERGPSQSVRVAAICRLTSASSELLSKLAEDMDAIVAETAMRKLKLIGCGDAVAEAERKAEASKIAEEERVLAEKQARNERERRAKEELMKKELEVIADSQIHSYRHFLDVLEKYPDIKAKQFRFSGKIVESNGKRLKLAIPCSGGGSFDNDVKLMKKPEMPFAVGETITVSGLYREGTRQSVQLERGTVVCRGIPSGPSAEVSKRIKERIALARIGGRQVATFRKYFNAEGRAKKEQFQFSGIIEEVSFGGIRLSLSVPLSGGETFSVSIKMLDKPAIAVKQGAVVTVNGRYREGTINSIVLDKGSVVCSGIPDEEGEDD